MAGWVGLFGLWGSGIILSCEFLFFDPAEEHLHVRYWPKCLAGTYRSRLGDG